MKELVEYIVKNLVDKPEEVDIKEVNRERMVVLELKVASQDVGKVIGRGGRTVKAIRTILSAAATKASKRVALDVLE